MKKFMKFSEGNVSDFQKKEASGTLPPDFSTIDEKDATHQIMTEVEPLLEAPEFRT